MYHNFGKFKVRSISIYVMPATRWTPTNWVELSYQRQTNTSLIVFSISNGTLKCPPNPKTLDSYTSSFEYIFFKLRKYLWKCVLEVMFVQNSFNNPRPKCEFIGHFIIMYSWLTYMSCKRTQNYTEIFIIFSVYHFSSHAQHQKVI